MPAPPPPTLIQSSPPKRPKRRRLWWHRLILGLWYRPVEVLDEARDRSAWTAATLLCLISGGLGVLSLNAFRAQWDINRRQALELVGVAEAGVLLSSLALGIATHAIARTLGGNGRFSPTVSLFIVLFWTTDLPRLALTVWLPVDSPFVQAAGWATWGFCYAVAILLIRGQHHLPTLRAACAVTIQMLASLTLLKLGPLH